jgi:transcriptional regulator with GAF, ATPase, and Fis domain
MESTSDSRFDTNYAMHLFLDIVHEQSVESLLNKLATRVLQNPNIVCVQFWLVDTPDRCLRLVAAGGSLPPGLRESDNSVAAVTAILDQIAAAGQPLVLRRSDEGWERLADPGWLKQEGILAFYGTPITFKEEVLGVTAAFRRDTEGEFFLWSQIFGNYMGASIANARAFEEIQRLKIQLELQNAYLQEEVVEARAFGDLVGQSAVLRKIVSQIDLVAQTEASVLILGETGTGKELVAHEIHRRSQRKDKPLVRVNCASIPRELFESEFFGHVRGSFTGAVKDRTGRFETAHGGTIFLDEIGEVPLEMQSKLLRVLQEKRYERVGDDQTRFADVRIIAATNRDLKQALAAGRFREDLYYRLHVFPIQVIPLRERMEDIPLLAKHFLELSVRDLKCAKPRLTRAGVAKLQNYDWPGNVRELRNVIERAVILARGGILDFDLPIATTSSLPPRPSPPDQAQVGGVPEPGFLTEAELQRRERDNLVAVLKKANWKIKGADGAAELLGVKPTTLLARMRKWGLKRPAA